MFDAIETQNPNKVVLWIVGGIAAIAAGSAAVAYLGLLWLIPFLLLAGAMAFWKYRYGWVKITLIYAAILSVVMISAYDVREWYNHKDDSGSKDLKTLESGKDKPLAGTPATPPNTPPTTAPPDQVKELADMKAALDKANAAITALQAQGAGGKGGTKAGDGTGSDSGDNAGSVAVAQPPDDLSGILPDDTKPGEEGLLLVKAKNCWYSHINEMTCRFLAINKDRQPHTMDVMDSSGTTSNGEESSRFITWRFGGAIRYADGDNRATLLHNVRNDILITFVEPTGGVNKVSFLLNLSGMDAINHAFPFSDIPVVRRY
jgi:hypothetical protein